MEAVQTRGIEDAPVMRTNSNSETPASLSQPHLGRIRLDDPRDAGSPGTQRSHSRYRDSLEMPSELP